MKNRKLLNLTRDLLLSLGYDCSKIREKTTASAFRIYIEHAEKLLSDVDELSSSYPHLDLVPRQKKFLHAIVERQKLNRKRGITGKTKEEILRMSTKKAMTIEEIAFDLKICKGVIARHLRQLEHKNLVRREGKKKFATLWFANEALSRDFIKKNILYKRKK